MSPRTLALTALALIAFAANSVLTRLALGARQIDAASFTAIRLTVGALMLLILAARDLRTRMRPDHRLAPLALFAYAAPFSFAYLRIGAAVGALVLFGIVQLTMISYGLLHGERLSPVAWLGTALAAGGLLILTLPSVSRPDPIGVMLMIVAGVAWAAYSIAGKGVANPIAANARNFLWSSPLALLLLALPLLPKQATLPGITLALISGAITSGLGYAAWYRAVRQLTVTQASVAQLTVPAIAALAAGTLLHETITTRLIVSTIAVLSGVTLVLFARTARR
ncbi:MAG: DMT family transporter [Acidobacteriota bacterium]|nr:DMT family transporter [Acidobacteriota bacterium]